MSINVKESDDLRKFIKVSLPLTDENLGYKHHLNISDDDIYYLMGKKCAQGAEAPLNMKKSKVRASRVNWGREELIKYAKESLMPLVPDDKEFIPRDYWCDFKELFGANLNNESHPLWQLSHRIIKDNFVKNSDIMFIQACGNFKPYIDNMVYQYALKKYREGWFDLFISSWECLPIDFSPFYPWRYYDWSHAKETPFMTDCCISHEFRNIVDFVEYFKYKKIIIFSPGGDDFFYNELFKRLYNNYKNTDVKVVFIWDKECIERQKELGCSAKGILKVRYNNLRAGRDKIEKEINYDPSKIIPPEDWSYGIEDKELIKDLRGKKELKWAPKLNKRKYTKKSKNISIFE